MSENRFLWNSCFITPPQNQIIIRKRQKQQLHLLQTLSLSLYFFLLNVLFCCPRPSGEHKQPFENPDAQPWEFPNWVMLQSAALSPHPESWRTPHCCKSQRFWGFQLGVLLQEISVHAHPCNFPLLAFHWSWKTHGQHLSVNNYLSLYKTSMKHSTSRDFCKTKHKLCLLEELFLWAKLCFNYSTGMKDICILIVPKIEMSL